MRDLQLSPKERRRFERCISNVDKLSSRRELTEIQAFILKQQIRAILKMLGAGHIDKVMLRLSLDILGANSEDRIKKLEELVNGRRR